MNVIANLAINAPGGYCGNSVPDENTILPADFEIDYIRVWQKTPQQGLTDLCAQRQIQGNSTICGGQQMTYNFVGPMTSSLNWLVSTNLTIVNQTTTSLTVQPISEFTNESAWITAQTSAYEPCPQTTFTKNIWIDKPVASLTIDASEKCPIYLEANVQPNNLSGTWTITSNSPYSIYGNFVTIEGSITSFTYYYYSYSVSNECGSTIETGNGIIAKCPEHPMLRIAPNPAHQTVAIGIVGNSVQKEDVQFFTITSPTNGFQVNLKWNGQDINLNVSDFPEGIYILSLKLKKSKKIISDQFLVKH